MFSNEDLPAERDNAIDAEKARVREKDQEITGLKAANTRLALAKRGGSHDSAGTTYTAGGLKTSKLADVPLFYNDKDKDTITFETWHRHIENKLDGNSDHYPTGRLRMSYVEGRLGGNASADLQPYLRSTHPDQLQPCTALLKHLWDEYYDDNIKEDSLKRYNNLEYRPGDDIKVFKNEFVRLAGEIRRSKSSWKEEFNSRLHGSLQTVLTRDYIGDNVGFEDFARLAVKIVANWKRSHDKKDTDSSKKRRERDGRGSKNSDSGKKSSRAAKTDTFTRPSTEETLKLRAEGKCFLCREKGHRARECPENKDKDSKDETTRISAMIEKIYKGSKTETSEN